MFQVTVGGGGIPPTRLELNASGAAFSMVAVVMLLASALAGYVPARL
jgi:hypothetical protein